MLDQEFKEGQEVFVCVIHNSEVYSGLHQEATISSCKRFLSEVLSGKRKIYKIFFAKGEVIKIVKSISNSKEIDYDVLITKLYLKDESDITTEGRCACYSEIWIRLGEYARERFLNQNPSRRRFIKGFE